jgi:hypothetical protein
MKDSQNSSMIKIPADKIFDWNMTQKIQVEEPYPSPIYIIPDFKVDNWYRPEISGLDLNRKPRIYTKKNLELSMKNLYRLFELEKEPQEDPNKIEEEQTETAEQEVDIDELIINHSGKNSFNESFLQKRKQVCNKNRQILQNSFDLSANKLNTTVLTQENDSQILEENKSEDESSITRADILYKIDNNKQFYNKRITQSVNKTFESAAQLDNTDLSQIRHPSNPNLKAKRVSPLLPCKELFPKTICNIHLMNKLEKSGEYRSLSNQKILGQIGKSLNDERVIQIFQQATPNQEPDQGNLQPNSVSQIAEYSILRKNKKNDFSDGKWLLVRTSQGQFVYKEVDYEMMARFKIKNKKFESEPFTLQHSEEDPEMALMEEQFLKSISTNLAQIAQSPVLAHEDHFSVSFNETSQAQLKQVQRKTESGEQYKMGMIKEEAVQDKNAKEEDSDSMLEDSEDSMLSN